MLILGKGIVGDATGYALEHKGAEVWYHDPPKGIFATGPDELDIESVDLALICVGSPLGRDGRADTTQVSDVIELLCYNGWRGPVGIRTTVPPGTCDAWQEALPSLTFFSWPEFLMAREARQWALAPRYNVLGVRESAEPALRGLDGLLKTRFGTHLVKPIEAEFIKYATNALLASSVGVANELAELAAALGIDWNKDLPEIAQHDLNLPRNIWVQDGGGFGGACLPKDLSALLHFAKTHDQPLPVLTALDAENRKRRAGRGDY